MDIDQIKKISRGEKHGYFGLGRGRDEVAVHLPAGGAYGKRRYYWCFSKSADKVEKKLTDLNSEIIEYQIYDLTIAIFNTENNLLYYHPIGVDGSLPNYYERIEHELSSEKIEKIMSDKDNIELT